MANIQFLNQKDSLTVSAHSIKVLQEILKKAGINSIIITSTARSANDQARIMYENLVKYGVDHQKKLYGGYGDQVIDVYDKLKDTGKSRSEIIAAMFNKILLLGPGKVSSHVADLKKLNVVDIAPGSIPKSFHASFVKAIENDKRVGRYFKPPTDPAFHIEIKQQ